LPVTCGVVVEEEGRETTGDSTAEVGFMAGGMWFVSGWYCNL
jgi:hypothetical protein